MIGYRIRRFLDAWREADTPLRAFLFWQAANTVLAFGLLFSSFSLLFVMNAPGFQRTVVFGYIAVAVCWVCSIFAIEPVYRWVDPQPE
jgi:hypothetical protein